MRNGEAIVMNRSGVESLHGGDGGGAGDGGDDLVDTIYLRYFHDHQVQCCMLFFPDTLAMGWIDGLRIG